MCQITISIPDEALAALSLSPEDAGAELRLAGAMKLYELERLSAGAAAALAGICVPEFLTRLSDFGIEAFRLTEEDFAQETRLD